MAQRNASPDIYEQYDIYRNPVMVFLNKFSFTLTTGYGATKYKHDLDNFFFYQDATSQLIRSNTGEGLPPRFAGFSDWLNDPTASDTLLNQNIFDVPFDFLPNPVFNDSLTNRPFLLNTDTAALSFSSTAHSIPIQFSIHYNYQAFRLGAGFNWEKQIVSSFTPSNTFGGSIRNYTPNFKSTQFTRLFGFFGYQFYEFWDYTFVAELEVGRIRAGRQFNSEVINRGVYTSIGVSIEQNWSQYFRIIIKPSFELKSFTVNLPDGTASIKHNQNSFFIRFGISINIPEIPRSPMKSDHVQLKHVISDPITGKLREVRGQPIWKKQNPKVGENHRKLWRYKNKNKRQLNPY